MSHQPPAYDASGLNVLDPHDKLGRKSAYITMLQEMALQLYLPPPGTNKVALDVGCGYGRLTHVLAQKGYQAIGIDPAYSLLTYARQQQPNIPFVQARLPELPVSQCGLILLQNVLRVLLLMDKLDALNTLHHYLAPDGTLVVVENIRSHPDYFQREKLLALMAKKGYTLQQETPIRFGRWPLLYLIRYGFVPERWLPRIAAYELNRAKKWRGRLPPWQYLNFLFLFKPPQ